MAPVNTSVVRPKLGRAPSAAVQRSRFVLSRKQKILAVTAVCAVMGLSVMLTYQNIAGEIMHSTASKPDETQQAALAPAAGSNISGQLVVVGEDQMALNPAQAQQLSQADKERLLDIVSAH